MAGEWGGGLLLWQLECSRTQQASFRRRRRPHQSVLLSSTRCSSSCSTWNAAAFVALRDCTVGEAASALASAARLAALGTLLQRHPRALAASVLDALACIPETLDPKQCAPLLRQVVALQEGATPPLSRAADATESALMASALRASGQYALLLATEPMCEASSGWHPPTQRQLAAWACERAQQLDAATGASLGGSSSEGSRVALQAGSQVPARLPCSRPLHPPCRSSALQAS